ncbi:MAG: MMPL family transporter [Myxococcota bacterium]
MSPRQALPVALALLAFGAMAAFVATQLRLTTGIASLLSESSEQTLARVSARLMDSPLTRTMVVSITAEDPAASIAVAERFAARLADHPEIESLRTGPDPGTAEAVHDLYFPRRLGLLSSRPEEELPARLSDPGLDAAAAELRRALSLPSGQLVKAFAGADPLQAFADRVARFDAAREAGLGVQDGHFVSSDDGSAILFLTTRHSAFDAHHQGPLEERLQTGFEAARSELGHSAVLERSSVHRFAVAAEKRAVRDMETISGISTLSIVLLFGLLFRSLRILLVSLLPLLGGLLVATSTGIAVFGEMHLMTLVFGATLIGICIDYPIHFAVHHTLLPSESGPGGSLARIWPALRLGAFTTVAGFLGLAWSDFPGVREIGVFAAVGILGALATTRWLLPSLVPAAPSPTPLERRLAGAAGRLLAGMRRRRSLVWLLPAAGGLLVAAGGPTLELQDDVFALSFPPDPEWMQEDERVRGRVARSETGRFVVVLGDDEEQALQRNDEVYLQLEDAVEAGELGGFRSLHTFLPSAALQRRNRAVLREQPRLAERTLAALERGGFRPEAFAGFTASLDDAPPPLRHADLAASPLADWVAGFRVDLDDQVAILTFVRDLVDEDALATRVESVEGARYFDQQQFLGDLYGRYRGRTVRLIALGLVAVVGLLWVRYRSPRRALATALPALLAAASTLALLALSGVAINLLHLLGTLLVLSIGVDYAIFLVAPGASSRERAATLLTLCVACASTCLAFGLLAFSAFPALRALGAATGLGVVLSLLFAPTVFVLLEDDRGDGEAPRA